MGISRRSFYRPLPFVRSGRDVTASLREAVFPGAAAVPRRPGRRGVAGLPACQTLELVLWRPPAPPPSACEVEKIRNVPYYAGPDAGPYYSLDLYLPRGKADFPVAILVHGGAWQVGDKNSCGLYASVGEFLARNGIGAVLPNYRLSPKVKHPEHVKDVARAFAWTREHLARLGGKVDRLYLVGHSAGGHLVSLLTADPSYLAAHGLTDAAIKGVVSVSGVYCIAPGWSAGRLGGPTSDAFRLSQVIPFKAASPGVCQLLRWPLPGLPLEVDPYASAFGDDPAVRRDASPIFHVRRGLPPFLLVHAEDDLPTLPEMALDFHRALVEKGVPSELVCAARRNHSSGFLHAVSADDPVGAAMLAFIAKLEKA